MSKEKTPIEEVFKDSDPRIDGYIDKIRESLKTSNRLFLAGHLFIFIFLISFYLYYKGHIEQVSFLGLSLPNSPLIKKWALIIPCFVYMASGLTAYLRALQYDSLERLIKKHYVKEYESGLFRMGLPSDFTAGLGALIHAEKKIFPIILNLLFTIMIALFTFFLPVVYIIVYYYKYAANIEFDGQILCSGLTCLVLLSVGMYALNKEAKLYKKPIVESKTDKYRNRGVSVDGLIIRDNKILLIKRGNEPFKDHWALPGGYVDWNESTEEAVAREVLEETGLKVNSCELIGVYSLPDRHPKQVINVAYRVATTGEPKAGDDALEFKWCSIDDLPAELAFDHKKILADCLEKKP